VEHWNVGDPAESEDSEVGIVRVVFLLIGCWAI
jgi:hypothetical protein